ncbi:hypothetical protein CVT26_013925 [Gymnopilus dilepis]|uniref:Uncharacterized protein n=1 Tax=Gymnopilus dilepis TaxID=231916 RepID=A0A409WDV5_9AGAR|nr:hypothetical protein CVT26_013925 [Gymnopilus dilepis]
MSSQTLDFDVATFQGRYSSLFRRWTQARDVELVNTSTDNSTCHERIKKAAETFMNGRQWPQSTEVGVGPHYVWQKFLYFIGVHNEEPIEESCPDDDGDGLSSEGPKDMTLCALKPDDRLTDFVRDPSTSIGIFLSSYARSTGLIWADGNLECMAIIIEFYVKYLLCNNFVPSMESSLRPSLVLLEAAKLEMPAISILAKNFPDGFSRLCGKYLRWERFSSIPPFVNTPPPSPVEGQSLRPRVDWSSILCNALDQWSSSSPQASDDISGHAISPFDGRIIDCTVPLFYSSTDKAFRKPVDQGGLASIANHVEFFLTHTTGIVERSLRRIKSIQVPPPNSEPNPAAVDEVIQPKKVRIVLEPAPASWNDHQVAIYCEPEILAAPEHELPQVHDPQSTDIVLLIDEKTEVLALLKPGMGLGGTWVQVLRKDGATLEDFENVADDVLLTFWYMDNLTLIMPSFWSVRQ